MYKTWANKYRSISKFAQFGRLKYGSTAPCCWVAVDWILGLTVWQRMIEGDREKAGFYSHPAAALAYLKQHSPKALTTCRFIFFSAFWLFPNKLECERPGQKMCVENVCVFSSLKRNWTSPAHPHTHFAAGQRMVCLSKCLWGGWAAGVPPTAQQLAVAGKGWGL